MRRTLMRTYLSTPAILVLGLLSLSLGLYAASAHATLISHYTFDDAADLGADATGTNNGTPMGGASQGPGKVGAGSLVLSGDDQYINVGGTDSFNSVADDGDGWTVATWIKMKTGAAPATGANTMRIFSTYYEDGVGWTGTGWGLGNDRRNGDLLMSTTYGIVDMWFDPGPTPDDEWTHWAYVYRNDGDTIATDYYVNGQLAGSATPGNPFGINPTTQDYAIGSLGLDTYPQDLNGTLDDLRVYDTELTAEEIAELYSPSPPVRPGDVNLDDVVNGLDVDPFVDVLLNGPFQAEADMNEDEVVNGLDVDPFVEAVVGGGVQAVPEPSTLALLALAGMAMLIRVSRRGCLMRH